MNYQHDKSLADLEAKVDQPCAFLDEAKLIMLTAVKRDNKLTEEEGQRVIKCLLIHWELTWAAAIRALAIIDRSASIELAMRLKLEYEIVTLRAQSKNK